jgi:hypothetical protein
MGPGATNLISSALCEVRQLVKSLRKGRIPFEIHREFIGDCNNGLTRPHRCALREEQTRREAEERKPQGLLSVWEAANSAQQSGGQQNPRPYREREGEQMRSSSIAIIYAIPQERCQARLLPSDSVHVLGRFVRHELNLPGKE